MKNVVSVFFLDINIATSTSNNSSSVPNTGDWCATAVSVQQCQSRLMQWTGHSGAWTRLERSVWTFTIQTFQHSWDPWCWTISLWWTKQTGAETKSLLVLLARCMMSQELVLKLLYPVNALYICCTCTQTNNNSSVIIYIRNVLYMWEVSYMIIILVELCVSWQTSVVNRGQAHVF